MILVGLPYTFPGQSRLDEITGGSPYGASTITGSDGKRWPSKNELDGARFQGRRVAEITKKITNNVSSFKCEISSSVTAPPLAWNPNRLDKANVRPAAGPKIFAKSSSASASNW